MTYQKASKSPDRVRCKMCGIWCDVLEICDECIERAHAAMRNLRRYQESIDRRIRKGGK